MSTVEVYPMLCEKNDSIIKQKSVGTAVKLVLVTQSCPTLCDPVDCSPPGLLYPWNSPGKNTGVGSHFLLQGSNPRLLHCRQILYHLSPGTWQVNFKNPYTEVHVGYEHVFVHGHTDVY